MKKRKPSTERIYLRLIPTDRALLDQLTKLIGRNRSETVRQALDVFSLAWRAERKGHRVIMRNSELKLQHQIVIGPVPAAKIGEAKIADSERAGANLEVRLYQNEIRIVEQLIAERAAATKSQLLRFAMSFFSHVMEPREKSWEVLAVGRAGDEFSLLIPSQLAA